MHVSFVHCVAKLLHYYHLLQSIRCKTIFEKGQVRIKMSNDNGNTFIATLYNVLLAPDLCDRLFLIITLMNSEHTCIFQKWFFNVYFGAKDNNAVTLPYSAQRKHAFL